MFLLTESPPTCEHIQTCRLNA